MCATFFSSLPTPNNKVQLLKQEYNIEVETALYLVDRSADRKSLPIEKIGQ